MLNRIINYFRQIDTSPKEILLVCFLILSFSAFAHYFWGESTATYLWLSVLTLWYYFNSKKSKAIQQKFIDIDERDMDFKDEYDQLFIDIEHFQKEVTSRISKMEENNK